MAKVLDFEVCKFELQSCSYIHFQTNNPEKGIDLYISSMDLIVPILFKDGFGIKQPAKADIPLNKETKWTPDEQVRVRRSKSL